MSDIQGGDASLSITGEHSLSTTAERSAVVEAEVVGARVRRVEQPEPDPLADLQLDRRREQAVEQPGPGVSVGAVRQVLESQGLAPSHPEPGTGDTADTANLRAAASSAAGSGSGTQRPLQARWRLVNIRDSPPNTRTAAQ